MSPEVAFKNDPYDHLVDVLCPHFGSAWHIDGSERFELDAAVLTEPAIGRLHHALGRLAEVYDELAYLVWHDPALLDSFFALRPHEKLMWLASGGAWRGIARADVFFTRDGRVQICEVNSDTPGGVAESYALNRAVRSRYPMLVDPNARFPELFIRLIEQAAGGGLPRTLGFVYPPQLTEDLSMVALYREWLSAAGVRVVLGAPCNLHPHAGGLGLLGEPIDFVWRHFKTDEWEAPRHAWLRSTEPDVPLPPFYTRLSTRSFEELLLLVLEAQARGAVRVMNPWGTVLTQNKLTLAFMWEHLQRFSPAARRAIQEVVPETVRVTTLGLPRLAEEQDAWVIKSSYGCEGAETVCGRFEDPARWRTYVECLDPQQWVAQRFFEVAPEASSRLPNLGIFLIGEEPFGCFYRCSARETTGMAAVVPVFAEAESGELSRVPSGRLREALRLSNDGRSVPELVAACGATSPVEALPVRPWQPRPPAPPEPGTTIDSSGGQAWRAYLQPERLIELCWPSQRRWKELATCTLAQALFHASELRELEPLITPSMRQARERGAQARARLFAPGGDGPQTLLFVDLPGEDSVAFAMGLAGTADLVFRFDNWPLPRGRVPLERALRALLYYAAELEQAKARVPAGASAVTVNDSRRLEAYDADLDAVLNAYHALVPPAYALAARGVRYIEAVYDGALGPEHEHPGPQGLTLRGFDPGFAAELVGAIAVAPEL